MKTRIECLKAPTAPIVNGRGLVLPRLFHNLGIDVVTPDAKRLCARLKRLKSTVEVRDGGPYWHERGFSQIHITTTKTAAQMEAWLYETNHGCDYTGVFPK